MAVHTAVFAASGDLHNVHELEGVMTTLLEKIEAITRCTHQAGISDHWEPKP